MGRYFTFIKNIEPFSFLSDEDIKKLENVCVEERFETDQVVFAEGSLGEKFFIVFEGAVEIWKDYQISDRICLAVYGPGKMFGELSLIDHLPTSATVVARKPSKLLTIDQEDFNQIITRDGCISLVIMKSLSSMIRRLTDDHMEGLRVRNRELENINSQLEQEIEERKSVQKELKIYKDHLEDKVKQRTKELLETNEVLSSERTNRERADAKVKILSGLLPICTHCKKIRDDEGYWNQIDGYIKEHSVAEIDHSICPKCEENLFPKFRLRIKNFINLA
jgi:CRP-like cAMP-binding protein